MSRLQGLNYEIFENILYFNNFVFIEMTSKNLKDQYSNIHRKCHLLYLKPREQYEKKDNQYVTGC